ncbi:MAG TPA: UvrD-helicase domain-containing protein [Holophagaceae bacterium]|nr:UvrD-helicase domain-containing protein [Holophagaceae bacterium]
MSADPLQALGRGHGIITASAGSGKTHTLLQLVLQEVRDGLPLTALLAVTFTKKGALELKARIREGLTQALTAAEDPDAARLLRQARRDLERATITTLHGFCQQALSEHALQARRPLDATLAPGRELGRRAFQTALRKGLAGPARDAWERALGDPGPERLETWLLALVPELERLDPKPGDLERLCAAFPPEAVLDALQAAGSGLKGSSLKPLLELIAQVESARAVWADPAQLQAAAQDWKRPSSAEAKWWQAISVPIQAWVKALQDFPVQSLQLLPLAQAVADELAALKRAEGMMDYGDLVQELRHALEGPNGEALAARLAEPYRLCLLDEAQDTSEDQWAILWTLFRRPGKRLVLVGDAKQAIFGFQGGDLPAFAQARQDLRAAGAATVPLTRNWRATPEVIETCNGILGLGSDPSLMEEPGDEIAVFEGDDLLPASPGDDPPRWLDPVPAVVALPVPFRSAAEDARRAAAEALADQLLALHVAGPRLRTRHAPEGRPFAWRDAFLLVRTGKEADELAGVLREKGVPFLQHKARGLYESDAAEDLRALLRALEDPGDASRRLRAFLTPFFGLGLEAAEGAAELPEDHPLPARLLDWARRPSLDRVVEGSGVVARLLREPEGQRRVADLLHLVELLQRTARRGDGPGDLAARLDAWAEGLDRPPGEEEDLRRLEQEGDAARILTLHAAKGLEAPVVALFGGLSEGGDPKAPPLLRYHARRGGRWERRAWFGRKAPDEMDAPARQEAQAELRRLLYVGLTRAQGLLLLPVHDAPPEGARSVTFDPEGLPKKGPYRLIQAQLLQLRDAAPAWLHWGPLSLPAKAAETTPPPALDLRPFPFEALKRTSWPRRTESFTSLQRRAEADAATEGHEDPEPDRAVKAEGLPGGAATGVLLHGLLEQIAAAGFDGRFERWWTAERKTWAEARCRDAGLDVIWAEEAARLAHAGFRQELALPGVSPVSLHRLRPDRLLRELAFLVEAPGGRLRGALDALFEHEGRAFVLDWKSNLLPDYGPATVAACVEEDYALQVRVYTLAALRALRITDAADYAARFGGVVYVFLRGLPGGGQWAARPAWEEVQAWEADLRTRLEGLHG